MSKIIYILRNWTSNKSEQDILTKDVMKNEKTIKEPSMKERIEKNISCLQKLKDNKKDFKNEMNDFVKNKETIESLVEEAEQQLTNIKKECDNMDKILNREDVVITIFGSVGKSYLMNALLHDEIFLSAADSTSCFVTVKKGNDNRLMYRDKEEYFDNVSDMREKINELTSNLRKNENTLNNDEVLEVFIKDPSKTILKDGVVIMNTPGADKNRNIHDIIKEQSQNSDIFIFMINSNITDVDKNFFKYQTETLVQPDIFIIVNKLDQYDNTDDDDEQVTDDSKLNITEECLKFIRRQNGGNEEDIKSQIYFISAGEALNKRTNLQNDRNMTPKQKQRYDEFVKFEEKLQEYIDNPLQNKKKRFDEEINIKIGEIIRKFKNNFKRWKENSNGIYLRSNELEGDVKKLKDELKTFINDEMQQFNDISSTLLNVHDVHDINKKLNELNKNCGKKFYNKILEQKIIRFCRQLDTENQNDSSQIETETSVSKVPFVFGAASKKENVDETNTIIPEEMREELKIDVEFIGKKMYYYYERILNEICKKVVEDEKWWKDYSLELDETVSGLF